MIPARVGPKATFHRYLTPKWAYLPLSGAGAAARGGRFNRPGLEALYLSAEPETAYAEFRQGAGIVRPATLAAYLVTLARVVDLAPGADLSAWGKPWRDWDCDWKAIHRLDRRTPPSWLCADAAIEAGFEGILFPSVRRPGGRNLVIYPGFADMREVSVHDPEGDLPRNQDSWRAKGA